MGPYDDLIGGQPAANSPFTTMNTTPKKPKKPSMPTTSPNVRPMLPGPNAPVYSTLPFMVGNGDVSTLPYIDNNGINRQQDEAMVSAVLAANAPRSTGVATGSFDGMTPGGAYVAPYATSGGRAALDSVDTPEFPEMEYDQDVYDMLDELLGPQPVDVPTYTGGGSGYGDFGAMLGALGGQLGPRTAPQYQTYADPTLATVAPMPTLQNVDVAEMSELERVVAEQLPEFQQYNPTMLEYTNFDPMRQNLNDVTAETLGLINKAYDPAIARLSQPLQTSIGSMNVQGQQVTPDMAQLANVFGVSPEYDQAVMDANIGIQNSDALFAGRADLLDKAFQGARGLSLSAADQSKAAGLSNANIQSLLAQAALERMVAADTSRVNAQNATFANDAGRFNAQGMNDFAVAQATINNNANTANVNNFNDAAIANWNALNNANATNATNANTAAMQAWAAQNNVNAANTALQNQVGQSNVDIANQQADADAAAGQPDLGTIISLITAAANAGQTLTPELIASLLGGSQ